MKKILFTVFCLAFCYSSYSQTDTKSKIKVTMQNDTVFKNGKPGFILKERKSEKNPNQALYTILSLSQKIQAMLILKLENDTIKFVGRFPLLSLTYSCMYPKIDFLVLMDSYVNNKVMVNDTISKDGLQNYCKERGITLVEIPTRQVMKPGQDTKRDSIMAARTKERMEKQFKFNIINKNKADVNIFLGDTTSSTGRSKIPNEKPFRAGRYEIIKPDETKELIGFEGEYICITDSLHKIYDLRLLKKDIKVIDVKSGGKKFD